MVRREVCEALDNFEGPLEMFTLPLGANLSLSRRQRSNKS